MDADGFGISGQEAATVALTAIGLYILFVAVVAVLGQRVLSSMSSLDVIVVITMGAVLGRAILGISTDLLGGAIAMLTLLAIQALFAQLRRWEPTERLFRRRPVALVVNGVLHSENLKRSHVEPLDVWARMRVAGVSNPDQVALMVLESTGLVSVIRAGEPIDRRLLTGVRGVEDM